MLNTVKVAVLILLFLLLQINIGYADTAEVLPKGVFQGEINSEFYFPVHKRFDPDGNNEDIAHDFNTNLNSTVFSALAALETGLGLPAGYASLGESVVSFKMDFTILELLFYYGLTDKISIGIKIPYWWVKNDVKAKVDNTNATVGFNPMHGQPGDPFGGQAPLIPVSMGGVPLGTEDVQTLLGQGFPGMPYYGYDRIEDYSDEGISDIEAGFRYQYFNNEKWRLALTGGVRLPTGDVDDPNNLQDYSFGSGATALLLRLHNDFIAIDNLLLDVTFKYDLYLSDNETRRVPEDVDFPITLAANTENVDRNIGNVFEVNLYSRYSLTNGLGFSLEYFYANKQKDDVSGNKGLAYSSLEEESNYQEHVYKIGLFYSTVPKYLDKTFPVPLIVSATYRNRFKGENLLNSDYLGLKLSMYF